MQEQQDQEKRSERKKCSKNGQDVTSRQQTRQEVDRPDRKQTRP
jgi:hypothetical protein